MGILAGLSDCLVDAEDVDTKMVAEQDDDLQVDPSELLIDPDSKLQVSYERYFIRDVLANTRLRD